MLLFSNAEVKTTRGGGEWVTAGEAGERVDEMEGKKKKRRERCLGRRNKAASECGREGRLGKKRL